MKAETATAPRRASAAGKIFRSVWLNRVLSWEMAKRELVITNKGSVIGWGWLVIRPFIQVAVYVIVVSFIFGVRSGEGGRFGYALYILSGLSCWQLMTKVLEESASMVRDRMDLLTQVIYPIEVLPVTTLVTASIGPAVALLVYIALALASGGLHWTILLLPVPIVLLGIMAVGWAWMLMIAGVIFKDLREIVGLLLGLLIYMSPVVLTENGIGPRIWALLQFNPLFHVVVCFRDVFDAEFHPLSWLVFVLLAASGLWIGTLVLSKAKSILYEYP